MYNPVSKVVILDWGSYLSYLSFGVSLFLAEYNKTVEYIPAAGCVLSSLVHELIQEVEIPEKNIRFYGFSLGAHVAGYASNDLHSHANIKVGRLTGEYVSWKCNLEETSRLWPFNL